MTRDELTRLVLGAANPAPRPVEVPGLGTLYAKVMTAYDADRMTKKLEALPKDDGCYVGRMMACVLCDESGELLFDAADQEAALTLSKLSPNVQRAVMRVANDAQGDSGNA